MFGPRERRRALREGLLTIVALAVAAASWAQPVVISPPAAGQAPSSAYQNVQDAINFLRDMGHTTQAGQLQAKLDAGEIRYDLKQSETGDTSGGSTRYITVDRTTINYMGGVRSFGRNTVGTTSRISLARTLFHELVHVNQSRAFIAGSNLRPGATPHEAEAWEATIGAMNGWIARLEGQMAGGATRETADLLRLVIGNLKGYVSDYVDLNGFGSDRTGDMRTLGQTLEARLKTLAGEVVQIAHAECNQACSPAERRAYDAGIRASALEERARGAEERVTKARAELAAVEADVARLTRSLEISRGQMARQTSAEGRTLVGRHIATITTQLDGARSSRAAADRAATEASTAAAEARAAADAARREVPEAVEALRRCRRACYQRLLDDGLLPDTQLPRDLRVGPNGQVETVPPRPGRPTTPVSSAPTQVSPEPILRLRQGEPTGEPDGFVNLYAQDTDYIYDLAIEEMKKAGAVVPGDPSTQRMISVLDFLNESIVISRAAPRDSRPWSFTERLTAALGLFLRPRPILGSKQAVADMDLWQAPVSGAAASPGQLAGSPSAVARVLRLSFTSLGMTTGEAFDLRIVNDSGKPVRIDLLSLVLEPVKPEDAKRIQKQIRPRASEKSIAVKAIGYCLEFLKLPPPSGMVFRVAPPDVQQSADPVRRILRAAKSLRETGALHPDSEPTGYFHSIRQWAIWAREQRFTLESFSNAFVEHTRKAVRAAGRQLSAADERRVRSAAPGRWTDIQRVLSEADVPQVPR
jgi:hypothetical protein